MYTCHYIIIVIKSLLLQGYEKWALAHLPGQVWKLLGGVQTLHFLMHLLKTLTQYRVLSKFSFHPCCSSFTSWHCYFYKLKNRNNILITESAADPLVSCYIHAVSPVKNAKSSNKKYFNCTLQKGAESVTVVCFVSQKQPELKTLDQTKAAVRVSNYNKSLTSDIVLDQPQQWHLLPKYHLTTVKLWQQEE